MYALTRIDAVAFAKVYTVASMIVALVFILPMFLILLLAGTLSASDMSDVVMAPVAVVLASAVILGLAIVTFIMSWLQAVVFNLALSRVGGLKIDLRAAPQD